MPHGIPITHEFNAKVSSGRKIRPEDAGIMERCDYCGWRWDEEDLRIDDRGYLACPLHLFDPEPQPRIVR